MKKVNRFLKKTVAVLTAALMLTLTLTAGFSVSAEGDGISSTDFAVISDIHYYAETEMGSKGEAFYEYAESKGKEYTELLGLLDSAFYAIEKHAADDPSTAPKFILAPGDLTNNGEYAGHTELAARFRDFEARTGIQVYVINGNHDVNNSSASTFRSDKPASARRTTPEEFKSIYAEFGYDEALASGGSVYAPAQGKKEGMLSYSVRLPDGFRLIAIDACMYSADNTEAGKDEHELGGRISDGLMSWILGQISAAKAEGETIIGMTHHALASHFDIQEDIFSGFIMSDWLRVCETLVDAGMHLNFSGHTHNPDITSHVSDNGETFYDVATSAISGFPNTFREMHVASTGADDISITSETYDVDCEKDVVGLDGTVFKNYRNTSFGKTFGVNGLTEFLLEKIKPFISKLCSDIKNAGGIVEMLESSFGIDLENIIKGFLGDGIYLGKMELFAYRNIASFIDDLTDQLEKKYIDNPDALIGLIQKYADKLLAFEVSDLPCTKYIDTIGFGSPDRKGTLEDAAHSIIAAFYSADENIADDPFIADVLDFFRNRDGAKEFFNLLLEVVLDDFLQDELLSGLKLNVNTLFPDGTALYDLGVMLQKTIVCITNGNNSFLNVINAILSLGIVEYKSINDIAMHYINEYLTQSQFDSWGYTISSMLTSFVEDSNPGPGKDGNATFRYTGKVDVVPTVGDFRLPSNVNMTLGEQGEETSRAITWLSKYSLTATDIEIVPYGENPLFTGAPSAPASVRVETASEPAIHTIPGADLGIIGFMVRDVKLNRHTVTLTGLEPGKKYCYRIGDAAHGWWSGTGVISAGDEDSDTFTFFHVTDMQSQNPVQYETFANVMRQAVKTDPEAAFIVSSGDQVDSGTNLKHWSALFNVASDTFMNLPFMPTTGNHEDDSAVLNANFALPNVPTQELETGVYYSYDYMNAHFAVLNTNDINDEDTLGAEQTEWLKKDMKASDADWKIVVLHKSIYSDGSHYDDSDVIGLRELLSGLLPALGVDMVLEGHDHVYLRTDAMDNNKVVSSKTVKETYDGLDYNVKQAPSGTVYSINACSGVKYYLTKGVELTDNLFPRAESIVSTEYPVFSSIKIVGDKLYYDAYAVNGNETRRIDSFAIAKDDAAKKNAENWNGGAGVNIIPEEHTGSVSDIEFADVVWPERTTAADKGDTEPTTAAAQVENPDTGSPANVTVAVAVVMLLAFAAFAVACGQRKITEKD